LGRGVKKRRKMVTPGDVLQLRAPTNKFLCPLAANEYGIEFQSFVIQDYTTKQTIFEVSRDRPLAMDTNRKIDHNDPDSMRKIHYELSEDFLRLPIVSTTLVFSVGHRPLSNFRMIERHYFRDELVKSFDFSFGFCIPGSTNTWDACYDLPPMDSALIDDMINHPYETSSDSFYFVGDQLIMHNKAYYKYLREDATAQCKSYEHKYGASEKFLAAKAAALPVDPNAKAQAKEVKSSHGEQTPDNIDVSKSADAKAPGAKSIATDAKLREADVWSKESDYL